MRSRPAARRGSSTSGAGGAAASGLGLIDAIRAHVVAVPSAPVPRAVYIHTAAGRARTATDPVPPPRGQQFHQSVDRGGSEKGRTVAGVLPVPDLPPPPLRGDPARTGVEGHGH